MTETPDFLLELGLRADADERDVRRAYAIELKKIDQEKQQQQFQRLRSAYEVSLSWVRHGREAYAAAEAQAAEGATAPEPQPAPEPQQQPAIAREVHEPTPPPAASRDENVRQILIALDTGLQQAPPRSAPQAATLLEAFLEDPRLLDMDARVLFEANVAHMLACGWRPGHEHLFEAALAVFEWRTDSARLMRFGQAGQVVDRAIVEQDAQTQQAPGQRDAQLHYLNLLRQTADPGPQALALGMGFVMHAAGNYPTWVRLTTNTEHIEAWRERDARIARSTVQPHPTAVERHGGALSAARLTAWFAIFFVGVMAFAALKAFLQWGNARAPVAPPVVSTVRPPSAPSPSLPSPALDPQAPLMDYVVPPRPVYPALSRRLGEHGLVTLRVLVDSTGTVTHAVVLRSSGFDRLDAAAVDALRAARVVPPKGGYDRDASTAYTASINFTLDNKGKPASP